MNYAFTDIFDIPKLTELCENFTRINGTVTALLDLEGNVHIKTGWQRICVDFHRVNPTSARRCLQSDTALAGKIASGEQYNVYQCANGLVDIAVPIHVSGKHVANFFTGQFLFQNPDKDYFIQQGKELGVELIPYMEALENVPVFDEQEIKKIMLFLTSLAETIGEMGKARLDILQLHEEVVEKNAALEQTTKDLIAAQQSLQKLASEDSLTGLYNRHFFDKTLALEFLRAKRYSGKLAVCLLDIDNFKTVNDSYGHIAGDEVLKWMTRIIVNNLRQTDIVSRLGGDEICIIFPNAKAGDILDCLEKIRMAIECSSMPFDQHDIPFTCSFGVTELCQTDNDATSLMARADKALYKSKEGGRNSVTCLPPILNFS